jgi:hypothetical protein
MELPDDFRHYPPEPDELSVSNSIARLIDGLGYRLYWALEGLTEQDCRYRISPDANSIHDILWHIFGLVNWIHMYVYGEQMSRPGNIIEQGHKTLSTLAKMRQHFIEIDDQQLQSYKLEEMSFWNYINMPLSDALSHVGQVRIMRRGAGNPVTE